MHSINFRHILLIMNMLNLLEQVQYIYVRAYCPNTYILCNVARDRSLTFQAYNLNVYPAGAKYFESSLRVLKLTRDIFTCIQYFVLKLLSCYRMPKTKMYYYVVLICILIDKFAIAFLVCRLGLMQAYNLKICHWAKFSDSSLHVQKLTGCILLCIQYFVLKQLSCYKIPKANMYP